MQNTQTNTQIDLIAVEKEKLTNIAKQVGISVEEMETVKNTVAKGATASELKMFLLTAYQSGLSPLRKEIWFYKDNKGNPIILTGRDGFLAIAQKSGEFTGLQSSPVFENDKIEINHAKSEINHIQNPVEKNRGALVGAWAKTYRKGCVPNITYVDNATYNKGWNTWKTHPQQMLVKCAEAISLKKTFGISGLVSSEEIGQEYGQTETLVINTIFETIKKTIETVAKTDKQKASDLAERELKENGQLNETEKAVLRGFVIEKVKLPTPKPKDAKKGQILTKKAQPEQTADEILQEFEEKVERGEK